MTLGRSTRVRQCGYWGGSFFLGFKYFDALQLGVGIGVATNTYVASSYATILFKKQDTHKWLHTGNVGIGTNQQTCINSGNQSGIVFSALITLVAQLQI
jgi:hypothetical protein